VDKRQHGGWPKDRISPELLRQLNHPVRREVLRLLHEAKEPRSPQRLSAVFCRAYDVPNIAYHFRVLSKGQLVTLEYEERVRAVQEKFFVSTVSSHERVLSILADTAEDDAYVRK